MKNLFLSIVAVTTAAIFSTGCNNPTPANAATASNSEVTPKVVTNPNLSLAPVEYSDLCEKSLQLLAKEQYDAWADMLADDVVYAYPDGDMDTRTKITGKSAVVAWWKTSKQNGTETMELSDFNHTPINVTGTLKAGAPKGIYDLVYFTNKIVINNKPVSVRMNFSVHFNADKKIDRYYGYYDRSIIIKTAGKNTLDELKKK